ncbi:hypothetical protein [Nannocystis pusilla]|uniref:hypothetical protein n=1 Tax=Nannocystis pusilla TaxID=889268 RepID=UPI003B7BA16A
MLLGGLPSLYHRAPEWAYTCVIRILRTRGDEDDCTAQFEQIINAGPADTRTLMLQILRELSEHPETDADQRQNIARTITAIGGDTPSPTRHPSRRRRAEMPSRSRPSPKSPRPAPAAPLMARRTRVRRRPPPSS